MKLYQLTIWLLRVFSYLYFVEIRALNPERIPESGPVILAANHPTSVLDAILLATQTHRQIHFLAKSGLFKNRMITALLHRLGAIPVYRAREVEAHDTKNVDVFEEVYRLFERGGCLGLFPEGENSPAGKVIELRTGGARMALGAEARNGYQLGLRIVPVGLNFEHRELFMSAVLLRFGTPFRVADYEELNRQDPSAAMRQLTSDLQILLRHQAIHVEDDQIRKLADDLSEALGYRLAPLALDEQGGAGGGLKSQSRLKRWLWKLLDWYRPDTGEMANSFETRIQDRRNLTAILARAMADDPASVSALRRQVDRYQGHLSQTRRSQALKRSMDEPVRQRLMRLRMTIYALLMAPVALFGLLHNLVPYLLTRYLPRFTSHEAIRAFAYFGVGFLAFGLAYAAFGFWLWHAAGMSWKWVFGYLALLPPTGFATLRYRRNIIIYRDKILLRSFFWNNEELVQLLRRERQSMIEHFQKLTAKDETLI
ncbi:MAG: 1-acyl-sn-glycerol-3-phosphate acyltransferase [Desulfobacterales bacterium]|nr:1-acyl-sn-glycerol-3-phosphate acyltransferase [Desulfobacterales bacterium]